MYLSKILERFCGKPQKQKEANTRRGPKVEMLKQSLL
jgi:hypothetical protein